MEEKVGAWWRVAAVTALLGVAGCSSPSGGLDDGLALIGETENVALRGGDGVYVLSQTRDLDAYPDALYTGAIEVDEGGCLRLAGASGPTTVLWPRGYGARVSAGEIRIVDAGGRTVVRVGEAVRMGGGGVPSLHEGLGFTAADHELAVSRCPGDFWLVTPGTVTAD